MTLAEAQQILDASLLSEGSPGLLLRGACASDLLSDVLAFAKPGALLLTGLVSSQVIRTAEVVDLAAVCFIRGIEMPPTTLSLAREKRIPVLWTRLHMHEACGRLHRHGLRDCHEA